MTIKFESGIWRAMQNKPSSKTPIQGQDVCFPNDPATEQAVLGCLLVDHSSMDLLVERGVNADWFFAQRHREILEILQESFRKQQGIDMNLLINRLAKNGVEESEAAGLVASLVQNAAIPSALGNYLNTLEECYKQRCLVVIGLRLKSSAATSDATPDQVIDGAIGELERIREAGLVEREKPVVEVLGKVLNSMEHYERAKVQGSALKTGLLAWDKYLGGIGDGCGYYHVISGRPGGGKTSLALQVAMNVAIRQKVPVLVVSMEMNGESCVQRMLFMEAQADLQRWRTGFGRVAANQEFERLTAASERIAGSKILIDDTGNMTCEELIARVKRVHRQQQIGLVVLDYIQLLRSGKTSYRPDRVQELSEISGAIRRCANRLKLPWLVLAQMNRDIEREVTRPPRLSDLKDCGAIEQDADTVTFVYRPHLASEQKQTEVDETITRWCRDQEQATGGVVWAKPEYSALLLAKNRFGPVGRAEVLFVKQHTAFEDYQLVRERLGLKSKASRRVDHEPALEVEA